MHPKGPLPPPSSIPAAAQVDELWLVKDKRIPGGNPVQGPRDYDTPRRSVAAGSESGSGKSGEQMKIGGGAVGGDAGASFEEYVPTEGSTFQMLYDANREEWKPEGCGELAPDPYGAECSP